MAETLLTMSQKGFGVVGVIDQDTKLLGIVTDGDLRRHMDGLLDKTAGDVMTPSPKVIRPDALAEEALQQMDARKITCLFVCEDGQTPAGLIKIHDCLRAGLG